MNLFTSRHTRAGRQGQIDIHSRTKPNEPVTLSTQKGVAWLDVAEDSSGDQACNLNQSDFMRLAFGFCLDDHHVAFIVGDALSKSAFKNWPGK